MADPVFRAVPTKGGLRSVVTGQTANRNLESDFSKCWFGVEISDLKNGRKEGWKDGRKEGWNSGKI
ncbi:MAG: hypothetical protein ACTSUE_16675 [Promethearchaeota archaeon]